MNDPEQAPAVIIIINTDEQGQRCQKVKTELLM